MASHMGSLDRKNQCVARMGRLMAKADLAVIRRRVRTDFVNLALHTPRIVCLRSARQRVGSSECRSWAKRCKANRGLDLQPSVPGEVS